MELLLTHSRQEPAVEPGSASESSASERSHGEYNVAEHPRERERSFPRVVTAFNSPVICP